MSEYILEMKNITKEFSGVKALEDVNLNLKKGEIHAICGENGAGKSTLMNVLSGVYPYGSYTGDIVYEGENMKFHSIKDSESRGIVIIHQELALSPYLSIAENVFIGNEQTSIKGVIDWTETRKKAKEILAKVGLTDEDVNAPINTIGVGKQQLVEIAKALAKNVKTLILDEPTAALNEEESETLLKIMLDLKEQGISCILISHKLEEVKKISDSITVLRDGKTIETINRKSEELTEDRIIRGMVGRSLTNRYPIKENTKTNDIALEVKNWNVFDPEVSNKQIIKDISFKVYKGEILGFAGLMGAGRTELARSIFGKSYGQKISGDLFINGEEVKINSVKEAIEHNIAYSSEDRKEYGLNQIASIKTNMTMAALGEFYSKNGIVNERLENADSEKYKKLLNVKANSIDQNTGSLSGGNQQKVVLAKWMMTEPEILILDEPTRGIDVGAKYEIYTIINDLVKQQKAVIVISSEMPELIGICDRVYVLNEGRIIGELEKGDITQEGIMSMIMKDDYKRGA